MKKTTLALLVSIAVPILAKTTQTNLPSEKVFYVYQDKGSKLNHFIPSGWMGDYGDLKIQDNYKNDCLDGMSCIEWTYTAEAKQGQNWAGAYWQQPANNWGSKAGGFDLTGYKRLTFWAKAKTDNVRIEEFKVGGITGEFEIHFQNQSVRLF